MAGRVAARVAIVGAGYAGMAAAVTLAGRGVPVTVFEAGQVPGGRARRIVSQGHELDNGQHILSGAYSTLFGLMRQVGVPSDALLRLPLEVNYATTFAFRRLWLPGALGLLGGLLLARGIPLRERLAAVRFMHTLKRNGFRLASDVTVRQLLEKHDQAGRIAHYLWGPLCVSALNTPVEQASASVFLAVLRDALAGAPEASDLLLPRVDLSRLFPEPAAEYVKRKGGEVRLRSPVSSLDELKGFDATIVAVAPHQLKALAPQLAPEYAYQPIYTCYLQYPEATRLPWPMLGMAEGLVQWVFDRGALLGEKGRLACVISAQGDHQQMTQDEVADACHRELSRVLRALPSPAWTRVIAEKRATIACVPNLPRPGGETALPNVFLAGDYTDPEYPPTLEAATRSGVRAAALAGFTVVELICVIVVIGLLAALALPRFRDLSDDAARAVVAQHAAAFRTSVNNVRLRYVINRRTGTVDNLAGFGDGTIDTNANGYPTDTAGQNTITNNAAGANRCRNVFNGILTGAPPICGGALTCNSTHVFQAVTTAAQTCRFNYVTDPSPARFFVYNATTGTVTVTNP